MIRLFMKIIFYTNWSIRNNIIFRLYLLILNIHLIPTSDSAEGKGSITRLQHENKPMKVILAAKNNNNGHMIWGHILYWSAPIVVSLP